MSTKVELCSVCKKEMVRKGENWWCKDCKIVMRYVSKKELIDVVRGL